LRRLDLGYSQGLRFNTAPALIRLHKDQFDGLP
jgi:hypothetical protein